MAQYEEGENEKAQPFEPKRQLKKATDVLHKFQICSFLDFENADQSGELDEFVEFSDSGHPHKRRHVVLALDDEIKRHDRKQVDSEPALKIRNGDFLPISYEFHVFVLYSRVKYHKHVDPEKDINDCTKSSHVCAFNRDETQLIWCVETTDQ